MPIIAQPLMKSKYSRSSQEVMIAGGISEAPVTSGGGDGWFTDSVTFKILTAESSVTPTDSFNAQINVTENEENSPQTEATTLTFPSPPDFVDQTATPTESVAFTIRSWLSWSTGTGVTNPTNANGQNNGSIATLQTAALWANQIIMTSSVGTGVPNATINSALYRGWFRSANTLGTSTGSIALRSSSGLFADMTIFTNSAAGATIDHLSWSFTFDLVAAGIDTAVKLQSLQVLHKVEDVVAGVTPHAMTVDAGAIEMSVSF